MQIFKTLKPSFFLNLNLIRFLSFVLFGINAYGQAPIIQWQKALGGLVQDEAYKVIPTSDGGYITIGYAASTDGDLVNINGIGAWIIKLNNLGVIQWQRKQGLSNRQQILDVKQTSDGGFVMVGSTEGSTNAIPNQGGKDFLVLKLNNLGVVEWQKAYGGGDDEKAFSVQQTTDGGYIVAGKSNNYDGNIYPVNGDVIGFHGGTDGWIIKINSIGVLQWQNTLGGTGHEDFSSVIQIIDGGYVTAGNYGISFWLTKYNSNGVVLWNKTFLNSDEAFSVQQTTDGGFILAGSSVSNIYTITSPNFTVIKVTSEGIVEWRKDYGGSNGDYAYSIIQESDGSYIVAGSTSSSYSGDLTVTNGETDCWIIKISSTGNIIWKKRIGGGNIDVAYDINKTTDGGYIMAGRTNSTAGDVTGFHGGLSDAWIVKLGFGLLSNTTSTISKFEIFPNPTSYSFSIQENNSTIDMIEIYDNVGKLVCKKYSNFENIDVSNLQKGMYLIKIQSQNETQISKLFVI